ncbi:MAG: 50S ribosomal protein L13 [Brevefilum sp.]|nr:50S ribosomal protein L13 [Brevefilum sp.]MDT8381903.1 50S ribosomal protein L13 [Brevefilum sp.]MDW7754809.1 50S ribosomal protein L13 [Brevefilum sp.]
MRKTFVPKGKVEQEWLLIDAEGQNLGRLSTKIAQLLIGKHKPNYTPGVVTGANVVVINAEKVAVYPTRLDSKIYYHHSNYPGGLKSIDLRTQLERHPERVIEHAVKGMIPKNKLGRRIFKNLHVYAGPEHPHYAQTPELVESEE